MGMPHREPEETWCIVPSLPRVMASSKGRMMLVPQCKPLPNGGFRQYGGLPTTGQWDGDRFIFLYSGHSYKVARLVCEAWHGAPFDRAVCMHLDENSRNNRPENLKWGTQKENLNAPGFIAVCRARKGINHPKQKRES